MDRQLVGTPPGYAAASVQIVWNAQKTRFCIAVSYVDSLRSNVLFLLISHWVWDPSAAAPVISFLPAEAASGIDRASKVLYPSSARTFGSNPWVPEPRTNERRST
jgi:hypothetical protein